MALLEHENIYANPGCVNKEMSKKASADLRKLASKLNAQTYLIPYYNLTAKLLKLPLQIDIFNSVRNLIGISNGIFSATHHNISIINIERANQVRQMLNIDSCLKDDDSNL